MMAMWCCVSVSLFSSVKLTRCSLTVWLISDNKNNNNVFVHSNCASTSFYKIIIFIEISWQNEVKNGGKKSIWKLKIPSGCSIRWFWWTKWHEELGQILSTEYVITRHLWIYENSAKIQGSVRELFSPVRNFLRKFLQGFWAGKSFYPFIRKFLCTRW